VQKAEQGSLYNFSRQYRLVSKQDFQAVFAEHRKVSHCFLLALFRANHLPHARLGMVVSKRIVKQAVARNRLKRVIREGFRLNQAALTGWDVVVIVRKECSAISKQILRAHVDKLLALFQTLT
jgi:ribonuclease P protein component